MSQQIKALAADPDNINKTGKKKMQRRNDDKSISDARARFLERKQQRIQDHSDTLKETG